VRRRRITESERKCLAPRRLVAGDGSSASTQEIVASAQELAANAEALNQLVAHFKLAS
jgi:methyl-accepting chemotaxis protein